MTPAGADPSAGRAPRAGRPERSADRPGPRVGGRARLGTQVDLPHRSDFPVVTIVDRHPLAHLIHESRHVFSRGERGAGDLVPAPRHPPWTGRATGRGPRISRRVLLSERPPATPAGPPWGGRCC